MAPLLDLDEDDDIPQLAPDVLALLQEFQDGRLTREKQFEDLKLQAETDSSAVTSAKLNIDTFPESWQDSQFWYTDATARHLAERLLLGADEQSSIAVVSAPSVYIQLRNLLSERDAGFAKPARVVLLEYDQRFSVFGPDFVPYDFALPFKLPPALKGKFDSVICDPPFLSEDCQTKTALTVRWLAKIWSPELRFITCTGERMEASILRLYGKLQIRTTGFEPEHCKGLGNEFKCYANIDFES